MDPGKFQESFKGLEAEVRKVIVGHDDVEVVARPRHHLGDHHDRTEEIRE